MFFNDCFMALWTHAIEFNLGQYGPSNYFLTMEPKKIDKICWSVGLALVPES